MNTSPTLQQLMQWIGWPTALINLICVNLDNYARAYDDRAVKKTLTIPAWLNTACENYGINYSKVLKDALIAKLQQVQM